MNASGEAWKDDGRGRGDSPLLMEKIERLAKLEDAVLEGHAEEMFGILRGFVVLDWILRNPNDLGKVKSEAKFEGLMEKARELVGKIQDETEAKEALVVDVTAGE